MAGEDTHRTGQDVVRTEAGHLEADHRTADFPEADYPEAEFAAAVEAVDRASPADFAAHMGQVGSLVVRQAVGMSLQKPQ